MLLETEFDRYLFLEPVVEWFSSVFRLNDEMMRLSIVLIGQYPLSYLLRYHVKGEKNRHLFSLIVGLVLAFFTFRWDALHFVFTSLGVYLICRFLPAKYIALTSLIWSFSYLTYGHWWRYTYEYKLYTLNWATTQMLLNIKLTSFAWSYFDGTQPIEKVTRSLHPFIIKELPSVFHYFSYIFFFPGFTTGPVGFFTEYQNFIDLSVFKNEKNGEQPDTVIPALKRFGLSLIGAVGFYLTKVFPESYLATEEYLNSPFLYRVYYLFVSVEFGFTKYYFAWFNGECSTTLCGASYNGRDPKTGEIKWDRINMLNFVAFLTGHSRHTIPLDWNICTGKWLRYYVFFRLPPSLQPYGVLITHLFSAFWHGFYPGYYFLFLTHWWFHRVDEAFELNVMDKYVYEIDAEKRTKKIKNPLLYKILLVLRTLHFYIGLKYWVAPFRLLTLVEGWNVWMSWYFIPHIFLGVLHLYFALFGEQKKPRAPVKQA